VKSFPLAAQGFELETELTVHALELRVPAAEIAMRYRPRREGSASKLNKWRDGLRILGTVVTLFRDVRPLPFFGLLAAFLAIVGLVLGIGVVIEYMHTGLVPRFPTAILATGLMVLASLSLASGIILDSVARGRREAKRLAYLAAAQTRRREGSLHRKPIGEQRVGTLTIISCCDIVATRASKRCIHLRNRTTFMSRSPMKIALLLPCLLLVACDQPRAPATTALPDESPTGTAARGYSTLRTAK
jgi:hypothetical protein